MEYPKTEADAVRPKGNIYVLLGQVTPQQIPARPPTRLFPSHQQHGHQPDSSLPNNSMFSHYISFSQTEDPPGRQGKGKEGKKNLCLTLIFKQNGQL